MNRARRLLKAASAWVAYVLAAALLLRPLLITTIVADDFVNPFQQYSQDGAGLLKAIEYGWNGAGSAGHFNYLGQIIGAYFNLVWLGLASELGVRFSTFYALAKLVAFLVCAEAAARYLVAVTSRAEYDVSTWRSRVLTATVLFASLQFHGFWSNDPVGSYPTSGYASAALGFGFLCLVLGLDRRPGRVAPVVVGIVGVLTILYYEINAAAVAAAAIPALWIVFRQAAWRDRAREAVRLAPALAIPAATTVLLQVRAAPESANYGGTSVEVGGGLVKTFWVATRSSLPGAGWTLTRRVMGGDQPFRWWAVIVVLVLGAALAGLVVRHGFGVPRRPTPRAGRTVVWLGATPVAYWIGATLLQASTQKVQAEVRRVGDVYNFYAIGSVAVALVAVLVFVALASSRRGRWVAAALVAVFALFAVVQLSTSAALSRRFYEQTEPNRRVLVAYSEQRPEPQRCAALRDWANGAWPEYYEEFVVAGIQAAYERFHGVPYCTGFVRPP